MQNGRISVQIGRVIFERWTGRAIWALTALVRTSSVRAQSPPESAAPAKQVLEIVAQNCVACHNSKKPAANLQLESLEGIAKGGASGAAIVPGKSGESNLYKRIVARDASLRMPPAGA